MTVGCGVSTVFDTLKKINETGTTNSRPRSGHPPLIEPSQRNWLKRLVTNDNTIVWTLHKVGLRNYIARRKPLISSTNMEVHLAWALEYQSWTKYDWAKVMWSDESTFSQFQQTLDECFGDAFQDKA
ncbi:2672_t:CDS:2 [Ambispora gerdemannii]|uniref:2672_t:CDS:1 n=1 Tax=Ambispora gerdemannii TaxID=144530 RepID=A0A9N9FD83_9GLOM|nr:2672_t:CDS:2 [Ambispora gerdemannii]